MPVGNSCATAASTGLADSRSVMASSFESKVLSVGTGVFGDPKRTPRARQFSAYPDVVHSAPQVVEAESFDGGLDGWTRAMGERVLAR